jgi:hypothetical protein
MRSAGRALDIVLGHLVRSLIDDHRSSRERIHAAHLGGCSVYSRRARNRGLQPRVRADRAALRIGGYLKDVLRTGGADEFGAAGYRWHDHVHG